MIRYMWFVRQTRRGFLATVKKRVGDLTFVWWTSRPFKSKSKAKRAAQRHVALYEYMDAHPQSYQEAWRRMVERYPLLAHPADRPVQVARAA